MRTRFKLSASLAIASLFLLGKAAASASADERHDNHAGHDQRGDRGHQGGWGGGNYPAPPVVYGPPGYYPPPVVYGPTFGIVLPGIGLGIR